jgi:PelA/Pel-15E family pectate lyase
MELCNSTKKYFHPNIDEMMASDITCSFMICVHHDISNNYKIMDKGERGEIYVVLSKERQLIFYYAKKKQLVSPVLECSETYYITFVRSSCSNKNYFYINGKLEEVSMIENIEKLKITDNNLNFYYSDSDYKLSKIKIWNYAMIRKQVELCYLFDTRNTSGLFKYMSNRLNEILEYESGISTCLLSEELFFTFKKYQAYLYQKNYPLDTFIRYNMENCEQNISQVLELKVLKADELCDKLNNHEIGYNLTTWQFGMYQNQYPKQICDIEGYWVEKEISPFVPYTGKGCTNVSRNGNIVDNESTFQSGMYVSYFKIIISEFIKTKRTDLLTSIEKTINFILSLSQKYRNGGVPLYFPDTSTEDCEVDACRYHISMKNGNYINYLRLLEIILTATEIHDHISSYLDQLKEVYNKSLNLLLQLQINICGTKTIWAQYYDKDDPCLMEGCDNEPVGLCTLESAQILLYLMDFETPSENMKNAIIGGCEWFKNNKIIGWIQTFDKKSYDPRDPIELTENQNLLEPYNYKPFPSKKFLHARYYDIETMEPIFKECDNYYTLKSFNDMSVKARSELLIGMWGQYLLEVYEQWLKTVSMENCNE